MKIQVQLYQPAKVGDLVQKGQVCTHDERGGVVYRIVETRQPIGAIVGGPAPMFSQTRVLGYYRVASVLGELCPVCDGKGGDCSRCGGSGVVAEFNEHPIVMLEEETK